MAIGNTKLHQLIKNIKGLNDLVAWYSIFDGETKVKILDLIREDQLRQKGVNAEGDVIGFYSYTTELISNGEKQEGTPYTFYDTGEFYRSMYMVILSDSVVFEADPMKGDDNLFDKYGSNILNLTTQSREKMKEFLIKNYRDYVRKQIFRAL